MATTTNYGWTTPDDTALVKDGASAIRTLGSSIDTSLNNALGTKKAGLVLLNTTSFSGVATQSINDVFNATYTNYKILITDFTTATGGTNLFIRMRVGGADASGASTYKAQGFYSDGGTLANATVNSTSYQLGVGSTTVSSMADATIYEPFAVKPTKFSSVSWDALNEQNYTFTGSHTPSTSYTGFTLLNSAGYTMTGTVSTYGFNI